jgi:hypothetical protein
MHPSFHHDFGPWLCSTKHDFPSNQHRIERFYPALDQIVFVFQTPPNWQRLQTLTRDFSVCDEGTSPGVDLEYAPTPTG